MDIQVHKCFRQIFMCIHVMGSPNYWHEHYQLSPYASNVTIKRISFVVNLMSLIFVATELSAYITQRNLDFQQMSFLCACSISQGLNTIASQSLVYYKDVVVGLVWKLMVECPRDYYDEEVGAAALKKTKLYVTVSIGLSCLTMVLYGIESLVILIKDGIFATFVTIWPQVDDRSPSANIGRVIAYIGCGIWCIRFCSTLATVISITICVRHQYKHVQCYFRSLVNIFEINSLTEEEKEVKYENGLKFGFLLHSKILNYTKEVVTICRVSIGAEVLVNIAVFVIMMCRIFVGADAKPITEVLPDLVIILWALFTTGYYMTTLGDLTFEAAGVRDAMYCSGWENCGRASAVRVRKLLGVGMTQTQNPPIMSLLGVFPVSHESYVSILKLSYSSFSLMYQLSN